MNRRNGSWTCDCAAAVALVASCDRAAFLVRVFFAVAFKLFGKIPTSDGDRAPRPKAALSGLDETTIHESALDRNLNLETHCDSESRAEISGHNLRFGDDGIDMIGPPLKHFLSLRCIFRSVVDARHSALFVAEGFLDYVLIPPMLAKLG